MSEKSTENPDPRDHPDAVGVIHNTDLFDDHQCVILLVLHGNLNNVDAGL